MERDYTYRRGCICWYTGPQERNEGSCVLTGTRPVLIISTDNNNETSGTVVVAPMTTAIEKKLYPGQFEIFANGQTSRVRCDQIRVVDKISLEAPKAFLNEECMDALDRALMLALGLESYIPEAEEEETEDFTTVAKLVRNY